MDINVTIPTVSLVLRMPPALPGALPSIQPPGDWYVLTIPDNCI